METTTIQQFLIGIAKPFSVSVLIFMVCTIIANIMYISLNHNNQIDIYFRIINMMWSGVVISIIPMFILGILMIILEQPFSKIC